MASICIDHDDTYTTDPATWDKIIGLLRDAGHEVFCISLRFPNVPITSGIPCTVYYSCGQHKWDFAAERGMKVDIWIDDWPSIIGEHPDRRGLMPPQYYQRQDLLRQAWVNYARKLDAIS